MIRKLTTKISPASCLAMVALFVALGGGAYAAAGKIGSSDIKAGAVTKAKIKKEAVTGPKIKQDAVTGAKVKESTLGTVPDAAKLAGKEPGAFESKGFGGNGDSPFVNLLPSSVTEVASQELPAGTYLVLARGGLNNNSTEAIPLGQECTLAAGGTSEKIQFTGLAKNGAPGDREEFSLFIVATLPAPGKAVLSCETDANWKTGNVIEPTVAAVSLQP
jgi:hypothetical protein